MEEKILNVIEKVRPYLNMDGGDIEFVKYEDGIVYIKMLGACAECMYVDDNISSSIESTIMEEIPEVKGVINLPLDNL